jgi:hypothetical protein
MRASPTLVEVLGACLVAASVAPAWAGVVNPDVSVIGQPVARWTDAEGDAARKRLTLEPGELGLNGGKYRVGFVKLNPAHHGQQHIVSRRLGNSASMPELSPALLRMTGNGIRDAARPLRPYFYQEVQCS